MNGSKILETVELLRERFERVEALSDYYDEISHNTFEDTLVIAKDKMKFVRKDILKATFETKNLLRRLEISERPIKDKSKIQK